MTAGPRRPAGADTRACHPRRPVSRTPARLPRDYPLTGPAPTVFTLPLTLTAPVVAARYVASYPTLPIEVVGDAEAVVADLLRIAARRGEPFVTLYVRTDPPAVGVHGRDALNHDGGPGQPLWIALRPADRTRTDRSPTNRARRPTQRRTTMSDRTDDTGHDDTGHDDTGAAIPDPQDTDHPAGEGDARRNAEDEPAG